MNENNYNLGISPDNAEMFPSGIAYIAIPTDVERSIYIRECYKTSTVAIYSEHNGFSNRVPIDIDTLNFIEFPNDVNEYGSAVSFILDPIHKKPIIVGRYTKQDELSQIKEHQFKFKKELNGNYVEIVGSSDGKYIGINVGADQGGEVFINVKSKDESANLNLNVEGECNINALTNTVIRQHGTLTIQTINREDETEATVEEHTSTGRTIFSKEENLNTSLFKINDGNENFILGQALKKFLKDLIKEISNATVTTAIGQMPLINKEAIAQYSEDDKIDAFLSTIGFIDK